MSPTYGQDTFANGGQLVDTDRWYAGRDKVQHFVAGMLLARLLRHILPWPWVFALVLLAALLWEMFEEIRYRRWRAAVRRWISERPTDDAPPLPRFADPFSWRDVVATVAGAGAAVAL